MPPRPRKPRYVVTARVAKPYGVLGWVKIEPLTTNTRRFAAGNSFILEGEEDGERLCLEEAREGPGYILAKFAGVNGRERAGSLAGRRLFVTPDEVGEAPPESLWEHQIVGLEVRTRDGRHLGGVSEVMETGANDVLVVTGEREYLIPMIGEVVVDIDLDAGIITLDPLPGLLED